MGHPPKAIKYITCRVMSFRPWQASCGPLRGLSCLYSAISLIFSIASMSPASSFHLLHCSMPYCCIFFLHSLLILHFPHSLLITLLHLLTFFLNFYPSLCTFSASWCMPVICEQRATEQRNTLQCHDPETPH